MIRVLQTAIALVLSSYAFAADLPDVGNRLGPVPEKARLALEEDWSGGRIDPARWYMPRRRWEDGGNNGVTPENVRVGRDVVDERERNVLVCEAHGDQYEGPVLGYRGTKTRVGGMIVSKAFFASGRFEVLMKIGSAEPHDGGPADPRRPIGAVPAVWTFAYRYISVPRARMDAFVPGTPIYNPLMNRRGAGANEYWSELDFPEFGRGGNFAVGLYNAFCQNQHEAKQFDVAAAIDGHYHTLTTEWRTDLRPIDGVTDSQAIEAEGFWWVRDKTVPFERYWGNPLKRLGKDQYAIYAGVRADHWIDGRKVAENTRLVPAMAAQLTLGVWLPRWAGPAPWHTSTVSFASLKVWQYDDAGDVRGVLTGDVPDNFRPDGRPTR